MTLLSNFWKNKLVRGVGYFSYFVCIDHCFTEYIAELVLCVGPSMEPTIHSQSKVLMERLSVLRQRVDRGDIVIIRSPVDPKSYVCKRVKALPGDTVPNGFFSETVPKGHVWLEGDNKNNSMDSRDYGPIPLGLVRGRVLLLVWPFKEFRFLSKYPFYEAFDFTKR